MHICVFWHLRGAISISEIRNPVWRRLWRSQAHFKFSFFTFPTVNNFENMSNLSTQHVHSLPVSRLPPRCVVSVLLRRFGDLRKKTRPWILLSMYLVEFSRFDEESAKHQQYYINYYELNDGWGPHENSPKLSGDVHLAFEGIGLEQIHGRHEYMCGIYSWRPLQKGPWQPWKEPFGHRVIHHDRSSWFIIMNQSFESCQTFLFQT